MEGTYLQLLLTARRKRYFTSPQESLTHLLCIVPSETMVWPPRVISK
jgi:hypothetical protein